MADSRFQTVRFDDNFQHIEEYAFSHMLLSSKPLGWEGIEALVYTVDALTDPSVVPELITPQDTIILNLEGAQDLKRHFDGHWKQGIAAPGMVCLNPKEAPILFHWAQSSTTVGMSFTQTYMADLIHQTGWGDPAQVELVEQFNLHDPLIEEIGRILAAELQSGSLFGRLYAESLTHTLGVHILRNYSNRLRWRSVSKGNLSAEEVARVKDYVDAHLSENIGLPEIAACVSLGTSHFNRMFKQAVGCAPYQYVIQRRVERAKELLISSSLTIAEIAQCVGFYDQSHLTRHFKRVYRISPMALRQARIVQ